MTIDTASEGGVPTANARVNILLVDDRADKLLALDALLSHLKLNVRTAHSGAEALNLITAYEFAVILLDVGMPIMDGFETALEIRKHKSAKHTPIIFVSANDSDTHIARGYSLGAVDYVSTWIEPEILKTKVSVFVDLFKKTEQIKCQAKEHTELIREQIARNAAETSEKQHRFLADASKLLASSLDYKNTLHTVAKLMVPDHADWCAIDVVGEDGLLHRIATAHIDPAQIKFIEELGNRFPSLPNDPFGPPNVIRTGQSELATKIPDSMLVASAKNEEHLQLLRGMGFKSYMCVPLRARDRILGTITVIFSQASRSYQGRRI